MATKYSESAQTGDIGIAHISGTCAKSGLIYRPFDIADIGIDGMIEFIDDNREPTGDLVLIQGKSGKSYVDNGNYTVKANKDHFESWARYSIPVLGIVYNPDADDAQWVDITKVLREQPERISDGPFTVVCPNEQLFVPGQLTSFIQEYRKGHIVSEGTLTPPNLSIRAWSTSDAKPTRALLTAIAPDYPDFYGWLARQWANNDVSKKVVEIEGAIVAYSMWSRKDLRNVKLQTFFVSPSFRGTAVGQHLLYHELRSWANLDNVARIYVTVSSAKADLIEYFYRFGFRVEGIAANKYVRETSSAELILTKHVVNRRVTSTAKLREVSELISSEIWGINAIEEERQTFFGVPANRFANPFSINFSNFTLDENSATSRQRLKLADSEKQVLREFDDYTLMREFYPVKLFLSGKLYVVIPIYRHYAKALFTDSVFSSAPTQLRLRLDNVYYCYPRIAELQRGDFVVFYETKTEGGRGAAFGTAIVRNVAVNHPEVLFEQYGDKGVFTLEDIQKHTRNDKAKAIHFDVFEPFTVLVYLKKIQQLFGRDTRFQSISKISKDEFISIIDEGMRD